MSLYLDLVGLNTLVREEIDENKNTIGKANTKCIHIPNEVGDLTFGLTNNSLSGYTTGPFSFCFWAKIDSHDGQNRYFFKDPNLDHFYFHISNAGSLELQLDDGASTPKQYFWTGLFDPSPFNFNWTHFCVTWTSFDSDPVLYLNGITQVSSAIIYGSITTRAALSAINIGTFSTTSGEVAGQMQHFAFFNKSLNSSEVTEIYSGGFINDLRNTSVVEYIVDYWKLGDEPELSSLNVEDEIVAGTIIEPTIGKNNLTSVGGVFIGRGNFKETRNIKIATVAYKDYLAALNTHRNGPYGHSTFKQLRASDNPLTRYQNKNNIFTTTDGTPVERRTIRNERVLSTHSDKHGELKVFDEVPVTLDNKPITSVINVSVEIDGEKFEEKLVVKAPFKNEISYFKNKELNVIKNLRFETNKEYEEFKKIYVVSTTDDPIIKELETIKFEQKIFPTNLYSTKNYTRLRPSFVSGYWRSRRTDRTELNQSNGFGHIVPSQSMWPLDAEESFTTQGLQGDPGTFRIYGPSFATASTTVSKAFGLDFPNIASGLDSIHLNARDATGSVTEFADLGYNLNFIDWAEKANSSTNAHIDVAANGSHLYFGLRAWWDSISDLLLGSYFQYDSVEYTITSNTRKGIYLSDLGSIKTPDSHRRMMYVQNIWRNTAAPALATAAGPLTGEPYVKNYRQHWFSSSVECGISFWNIPYNHPEDAYNTLMFDISSSVDPAYSAFNGDTVQRDIGITAERSNVGALRRHIYFSTGSTALTSYTGFNHPALVVRLGTKWFKNDGTIHYGNTPESGAVEFLFDKIYTDNNPLGLNSSGGGTRYLKPMLGRQQHFYISLDQSHLTTFASGNVYLAINGERLSASAVNDQWGFFGGRNHEFGLTASSEQGYTASHWTAADTGSIPTDVTFFQAGDTRDHSYMNEMYFSDIAIFSGSFNGVSEADFNSRVKKFCGGVTGTESITDEKTGIRYANYSLVAETITEISGPFLWYDFEKTDTGTEFEYSFADFGLSSTAGTYGAHYDYSGSGVYSRNDTSLKINIEGYVEPVAEDRRLDNRSYADFTITPGANLDAYVVKMRKDSTALVTNGDVGASHGAALEFYGARHETIVDDLVSPDDIASPIGGSTGFNSSKGPGVLQNSYSQFSRNLDLTTATSIDIHFSASAFYSRRHSLTSSTSVKNPFFNNISPNGLDAQFLFLGSAFWDAPDQAGFFDSAGSFVSSSKEPFYDTYGNYAEELRGIGKDYSIVPEFRISNHVPTYLVRSPIEEKLDIFEISGGLDNLKNSSQSDFYTIYSNSDFLELFDVVKQDHKKFFDPYKVTLQCKAIKKFLPYKGFYPCQRTVEIAQQFYSSYGANITATSSVPTQALTADANYPSQYLMNPLFGPGVLFNTIKSGVACDYPIVNTELVVNTGSQSGYVGINVDEDPLAHDSMTNPNYFINQTFDTRIPFEALIEPEKHLANIPLFSNEPDPKGNTKTEVIWNGQGDELYKLKMNNFLAEVGNFFLVNENYTTLASLPEGDPNFGNAEGDKVYKMRLKMYRSITGSKATEIDHYGVSYGVPQDTGSMGENFTMYSRPSAFGPPTQFSASTFTTSNWNSFKKQDSERISLINFPNETYGTTTAASAIDGFNFPFTPPYYHGEAWADITFIPPSGSKKYSLSEIINNSSVEFCRFFTSGSNNGDTSQIHAASSASVANNDQAMQIASSMNIFSRGILREDVEGQTIVETELANKYRWIMQTKFETPTLNFNHHSHDTITMPNLATSSVPIGMWHQYGRIPQQTNEGIFVQVEDIPTNWTRGPHRGDINKTGSLLNVCGFSSDPVRVGDIKDAKKIEEAVVAVPFVRRANENVFFKLNPEDVENAINGKKQFVGKTINKLVQQMKNYVFPPSFDFVNFSGVEPIAMYVFEFSHTLSKQDLADIWQNLPPDIATTHEISTAEVSHELFAQEFFGRGAVVNQENKLEKFTDLSNLPSDIRWMVFKVKKRASSNYFEKMFERNDSGTRSFQDQIASSTTGKKQKIGYNWPYDFFSLVELIKLDASVEFGKIDKEKSIDLDQTFLKPVLIKDEE